MVEVNVVSLPPDRPLTFVELADFLGRYRYVELALFALVGQRAAIAVEPSVCVYLSGASHAHSFRAGLIEDRLPVSVGLPGIMSCTRTPGEAIDEMLVEVSSVSDAEIIGLLAGGWYPAMLTSYLDHLDSASPPSDAPVIRMLRRIVSDLEECIDEGSALAQELGLASEAVEFSKALAACGGPFGTLIG